MSNVQVTPNVGATAATGNVDADSATKNLIHISESDTHANYWSEWAQNRAVWNARETRRESFNSRFLLAVKLVLICGSVAVLVMWVANTLSAVK
jgi:hypothetical protein